jgi:hypothetical protein
MRIEQQRRRDVTSWKPARGRCRSEKNYELWEKAGAQSLKMKKWKKRKVRQAPIIQV